MSEIFGKYCSLQAQENILRKINIELTRELLVDYFYGREVHVSSTKLKDICEKNSDTCIYMLAKTTDNFSLFASAG